MAGKIMHLVNRKGRYHARLVVPKDLRGIVGKTELRSPLGGDYRQALKLLPGAVAQLQHKIALAEQEAGVGQQQAVPARYPLAPDQLAHSLYTQRLAFDDELRNDSRWPGVGIDDLLVQRLRAAIAGNANDGELGELVGAQIERFRSAGNLDATPGSTEWREIARALCHAELEALARAAERDEGDFTGTPTSPVIKDAQPLEKTPELVSMRQLWSDYISSRVQAGFMRDQGKRLRPVEENLRKFLKHDDARRITKKDLLAWRDHLMKTLSAKTVNDIYLSGVRSLFSWAADNDRLPENVAANVKQPKPKKVYGRERGYTDAEAVEVLKASRTYQPKADEFGYVRETEKAANLKRWVPIICAFTGARVSEITQLRKEDIRKVDGQWVARITPDAGTVKAGGYRDVPLHPQIIQEGFADFVNASAAGPLFHNATEPEKFQRAAVVVSNKLSDWLRLTKLTPEGLQPNHAWRHRLKTQCRELGISDRVVDAIQGHAGKTAGDHYGDVTLKTKVDAISKLPKYELS
ncbi:DUF6538 domain-containing protein [Phaeobacter inhibens]|uniref:DUF6538 domain-containing protein n=1 Tax=Phaeobacter inhibens TaxID=221822 RepID=UPI0021A5584F|nr:DUF6538 domain-containing protein [Phaeobacter inhibens]